VKKKKGHTCQACPAFHDPCLRHGIGDNPTHLIVVGVAPSGFSIGKGKAFYGPNGRLFDKLMGFVRTRQGGRYSEVKTYKTYAALVGAQNPTAEHVLHCHTNLHHDLESIQGIDGREPVLVPLGPMALKAIGVNARKITDVVGRVMTGTIPAPFGAKRKVKVVPCLSMEHIMARPGTAPIAISALVKATRLAYGERDDVETNLDALTSAYRYPNTVEEVKHLVDEVISYRDSSYPGFADKSADFWPIAVDTETNTLHPYYEDAKTLMLSVAWDEGQAATILLDHPDAPWAEDTNARTEVWRHVKRLLECPKPKVFHNWKFDHKFLEIVNGIRVNNVKWDTMLGEHFLEEDKKGLYSLKQLTPVYVSGYEGYDDELQALFRKEGAGSSDGVYAELYISDDDILKQPPMDGRDEDMWEELQEWIKTHHAIKNKQKTLRSQTEELQLETAKRRVKALRDDMGLKKPAKKVKASAETGFAQIPLDVILQYAAVDADVTRIIFTKQLHRASMTCFREEARSVMNDLYLPGSRVLSRMEHRGFRVDRDYLERLENEVNVAMVAAERQIHNDFSPGLNLRSARQIAGFMQKMNFETIPGAERGSTGKDILKQYMKHYSKDDARNVFCGLLLEYRECHKTLQTYLKPIRKLSDRDGFIHCVFHLNGTSTGRLSSVHPNMQNIPLITCRRTVGGTILFPGYNIKKLFIPSEPGFVIVNCDISGAELRVFTAYSHDPDMTDALNRGLDIHSVTTSKVYGIPYEEVVAGKETDPDIKKKRTNCKRVVFGALYGAGPFKISEQVGCTIEEARELQSFLFKAYPKLRGYIDDTHTEVRRDGFVKTFFGRVRRFKMAALSSRHEADAQREAVNFKIQSTSSDLVLSQLVEMDEHIADIGGRMLISVHDSYVMEVPESRISDLPAFYDKWIVGRVRERFPWLPVPFAYNYEVGPSYGELHEIEEDEEDVEDVEDEEDA